MQLPNLVLQKSRFAKSRLWFNWERKLGSFGKLEKLGKLRKLGKVGKSWEEKFGIELE